ncbi:MAG: pectinesterase family protein [Chitinophagaceae bacterium]
MKKIALMLFFFLCSQTIIRAQTYNATVAKDGSGTHTTVAAAISSAPTNSTTPYYIFVKSGVYNEKDTVPTNRPNIIMVGENVLTTVIYNNDNATTTLFNGSPIGTSGSAAFFVNGAGFNAFNITFQNNAGVAASQAVAVNISGDKAAFRNCRFLGFQDVLYCKNSGIASYFNNCYIEGTVDFIFGASTSYFDNCYIYCKSRQSGGIITAPNTAAGTSFGSPWGFVFNNCKINGASNMTGLYYLGRPWQNKPQSVFLNSSMTDVINGLGWSGSSAGSATTADVSFGEYNSSGSGGGSGSRAAFSTQLSALQAANYTLSNIFGSWDPCSVSGICNTVDFPIATANFTGTQINSNTANFSWNMCWPLVMTYTIKRSTNGGAFSTIDNFTGSSSNYNYTSSDNSMPSGVNRYILQMTNGGTTLTSTDTITISNQPTVTTSVSSLSAFTQTIGTPSFTLGFTVSGSNLTNNITVTAPSNFQVSPDGVNWSSSYSITQSGGVVAATTVNVRLNAGSNGSYSGNVTCATTGGNTVSVAVSGTTSSVPPYVATLLQQWPLTTSNADSSGVRAVGINASSYTGNRLFVSNNATTPAFPPYSGTYGLAFGPSTTTTSNGLWTTANNGTGGNLSRLHYLQFTISGETGYGVRIDSLILSSAFYNTNSNTRLAVVYSKSGFASDSADITSGGTLAGSALSGTAFGSFANPIALANQTGGPTNVYRLPLNSSTGVTLTSGQTLTVRLYFACGSTGTPRHAFLKNVQLKGSVTAPAPTITSFTPTSQISGGNVVITGTSFSNVTSVSFGGTNASSFTVNSGTQITATVANGTSGNVSVTTTSGTATLSGFTFQTPTTYYNVANSDVTNINNWGTNPDGSGTNPSNFTSNLQTFKIANSGATMSGAWTVSGTNSKIVVGNGSAVFNQTENINGIIDVEDNGDLEIKVSNAPTLGTLFSGSTVGYSGTGVAQNIAAANYYNLTLSGSGARSFPASVVGIANQFTNNSFTSSGTGSIISFNGNSPQTIPSFTYDSLIINNTNGCATQGGGSAVVVNRGLNIFNNFTVDAGDLVTLASTNGVAFTVASGKTLTVSGTLNNQSSGVVTWGSLSSSASGSTAANADSARFVVNSGGIYRINAVVPNSYYISVGSFKPGSEIQVQQGSPRIPFYVGGNVTWNSTGVGTLIQQNTSSIGGNLTVNAGQLNNGAGGTGRTLNIYGKLKVQGGEYEPAGLGNTAAQIVNVYDSIVVTSGNLYATLSTTGGTGTINSYGNIVNTGGNLGLASTNTIGGSLILLGSTTQTLNSTFQNQINLVVNNTSGVNIGNNISVANLTLTNGVVNMGNNTLAASGVTRTNGWVRGILQKRIAVGTNVAATFELGDAANYLPVNLTFASVSSAGDVAASFNTPISAVPNYATAPISCNTFVNKYWTLNNVNTLAFTTYDATFNYVSADLSGGAVSSSLIAAIYGSNWTTKSTSFGTNANTVSALTNLGNVVLGNSFSTVTPFISISTASTSVCSGNSVSFTANGINGGPSPSYQWTRNGSNVGSGSAITFLPGTLSNGDVINCILTANNPCQTTPTAVSNTIQLTVKSSPVVNQIQNQAGTVINSASICILGSAGTTRYGNTTPFGTWSSSDPLVVSVNNQGFVTGNSNGIATVSYSLASNNGCVATSNVLVTVAPATAPNAITGASNVCAGSSIAVSNSTPNGVWSCLQTSQATVNSTGVLLGKSAGFATVNYTITNAAGCTALVSKTITVNALPAVPLIAYAPGTVLSGPSSPFYGAPTGSFCVGKTFSLTGSPAGGSFNSSGVASIIGNTVTINAVGAGSITYTFTNSNGCSNSRTLSGNGFACAARGVNSNNEFIANNSFTMFPNPARNTISLQINELIGSGNAIVTDLYGKVVKSQSLSIGTNTIDITKLAKGFYLVSVVTNEGKSTKKLIVE